MSNDRRVTAVGKQVLLDGAHLADAASEITAECIAEALDLWLSKREMHIVRLRRMT